METIILQIDLEPELTLDGVEWVERKILSNPNFSLNIHSTCRQIPKYFSYLLVFKKKKKESRAPKRYSYHKKLSIQAPQNWDPKTLNWRKFLAKADMAKCFRYIFFPHMMFISVDEPEWNVMSMVSATKASSKWLKKSNIDFQVNDATQTYINSKQQRCT